MEKDEGCYGYEAPRVNICWNLNGLENRMEHSENIAPFEGLNADFPFTTS